MPDLSALFSACTLTDAYSVASIFFLPFIESSVWHFIEHLAGSHQPTLTRTRRDAAGLFAASPSHSTTASMTLPYSSPCIAPP